MEYLYFSYWLSDKEWWFPDVDKSILGKEDLKKT